MKKGLIGFVLISIGVMILGLLLYFNFQSRLPNRVFSPYTLLSSSWEKYKKQFINEDGRVIDYSQNSITTSEGQSYALLRAVWIDDKESFDLVWKWTGETLKRPNDNLFGWRWGERVDKTYGFLEEGGINSASDADTDIALALILASRRWGDEKYLEEAKKILDDLWEQETEVVLDKRYLVSGDWARGANEIIVNPSYFSPYAWRIFAQVDKDHDWNSLVDPAYDLLENSSKASLDKGKSVGLPPNWIAVDRTTGDLRAVGIPNLSTDYSFDAIRVPWRIALDYHWNKDKRAYEYLSTAFAFLEKEYNSRGKLMIAYSHDGVPVNNIENPSMYATSLGYFSIVNRGLAEKIYQDKILKLYSNDTNTFRQDIPYYEQNWLWFGAALHNEFLIPFEK